MTCLSEERKRRQKLAAEFCEANPPESGELWGALGIIILFLILLGGLAYGMFKAIT